ncbi:hypothetical protein ElyMa_000619500 [Elysia marginata]|uniref:YqaJ viral recombinase domain-containing protein n=1 Tax=Elysia marginata TaxID=1093978 RepID=A0AAV4G9H6_9GAST|nr:hypothetical protein ElyMa_000619500 [Elysia marginata]
MKASHQNVKIKPAGLFVKNTLPYIGASPDGVMHCDCHGQATVEIKCPYSLRGMDVFEHYSKTEFIHIDETGNLNIKKDHEYYFQVQAQLAVTMFDVGYFCVYTAAGKPLILTISKDEKFWNDAEQKLVIFFKSYLSKYLLGFNSFSFCPSCDKLCIEPDECKHEGDNCVCCDVCNLWFHWKCQNYTESDSFICSLCSEAMDY